MTPQGKFQFNALPFGLKNAPAGLQRLMDSVLAGEKSTLAYINDVMVHSQTWDKHLEDLERHSDNSRKQALQLRRGSDALQEQLSHSWVTWWAEVKLGKGHCHQNLPVAKDKERLSGPF